MKVTEVLLGATIPPLLSQPKKDKQEHLSAKTKTPREPHI